MPTEEATRFIHILVCGQITNLAPRPGASAAAVLDCGEAGPVLAHATGEAASLLLRWKVGDVVELSGVPDGDGIYLEGHEPRALLLQVDGLDAPPEVAESLPSTSASELWVDEAPRPAPLLQ